MSKNSLPKIIFLVNNPFNGSTTLRAKQIADELNLYGYQTKLYSLRSLESLKNKSSTRGKPRNKMLIYDMSDQEHNLGSIKNSIVIILKRAQSLHLGALRRGKNKILLDPVDYIYYTKYPTLISTLGTYDGIICCNELMKKDLTKHVPAKKLHIIYHHWDVRLRERRHNYDPNVDSFEILFSGFVDGVSHDRNILPKNLNCYHLEEFKIRMTNDIVENPDIKAPFHYNIRQSGTWNTKFKSNIKLSNAAVLGCNIITTPDQSYGEVFELCGLKLADYPYTTTEQADDVAKMIKSAEKDYLEQNERWISGLKMMDEIRKKTDLKEIILDYIQLIKSLSS